MGRARMFVLCGFGIINGFGFGTLCVFSLQGRVPCIVHLILSHAKGYFLAGLCTVGG